MKEVDKLIDELSGLIDWDDGGDVLLRMERVEGENMVEIVMSDYVEKKDVVFRVTIDYVREMKVERS